MGRLFALHRRLATDGPGGPAEWMLFFLLCLMGELYGLIGRMRRALYRLGVFSVYRAPVPVISVGNLTVGGTGKTPMTDYLLKRLMERGLRAAVVSRGYGGRGFGRVGTVSAGEGLLLSPEACGDEPYLLAQRNPRALVLVAQRRSEGIRLACERLDAQVILLDDGFQHLAVARDLDIVLLDARRPLGNGRLLPAGTLREQPSALTGAELIVLTRSEGSEKLPFELARPLVHCRHRLADEAVSLAGDKLPLGNFAGLRVVAFAGIADPESFFTGLSVAGLHLVQTVAFPDHAIYDDDALEKLADAARNADFLVTTEKDGVKLRGMSMPVPCYQVPISLEFHSEGSFHLERALDTVLHGRCHGPVQRTA